MAAGGGLYEDQRLAADGGLRDHEAAAAEAEALTRPDNPKTMESDGVPELSRFFGIVIRMFMELGAPHHRPHFHAVYQDTKAVFALDPIECIGGELPRIQQRLVEAWAEIHREELLQDWALLQSGRPPFKIEPLH